MMTDDRHDTALPDLGGILILLADDNQINQMVASEMLLAMGAKVDLAADGAEALEMLAARSYDVLLLDIEMPRISGIDVIRAVRRSDSVQARRPMLALTAYAREDHGAAIFAAGADGVISKPISGIAAFGDAILTAMGRRPRPTQRGPLRGARAQRPQPHDAQGGFAEAPAGAAPTRGKIDPAVLAALSEAVGPARMHELLTKVIADIAASRAEAAQAVATADMVALRRATHVLTAVAGTVGALRLQRMAERWNDMANHDRADQAADFAEKALEELDGVLLAMTAERDRS
ncbi:MAG: two-component system aerobic respiration control sensor histidine kinase ArcB [Paracoccaceae bacterium]|jgi:two-component system aerobic respiration control sensor histidine kinase ArcB